MTGSAGSLGCLPWAGGWLNSTLAVPVAVGSLQADQSEGEAECLGISDDCASGKSHHVHRFLPFAGRHAGFAVPSCHVSCPGTENRTGLGTRRCWPR